MSLLLHVVVAIVRRWRATTIQATTKTPNNQPLVRLGQGDYERKAYGEIK